MYLHIGNGSMMRCSDIIGIFNMDTATVSGITRSFLRREEQRGGLICADDDIPRSFVLCMSRAGQRVYLTRISAGSLCRRAETSDVTEEEEEE